MSRDIAQDVYLAAWTGMRRLRTPTSFLPWLRQITRNQAHHALRTERRRRLVDDADALLAAATDPRPRADEALVSEELYARVAQALSELPQAAREVVVLYYREGQSIRHVAELLGLTEEAVKQRLSRARARLRDDLSFERAGRAFRATAPTAAFTAAVALGLSAAAPATAAAGGVALAKAVGTGKIAAKLAAAGVAAGSAAAMAGAIGAAVGGLSAALGGTRRLRHLARDEEELRDLQLFERASVVIVALFAATFLAEDHRLVTFAFLVCMSALSTMHLVWLPRILSRRLAAELAENPEVWRDHRRLRRRAIVGCVAGFILGGTPLVWAWWRAHRG